MARVTIADLCISYGGANIIEKLDLDVHDGEFLVLLGPSGCGKSTLLHSIAGLVDVSDGRIAIGDKDVTWADPKDRSIGMVFKSLRALSDDERRTQPVVRSAHRRHGQG